MDHYQISDFGESIKTTSDLTSDYFIGTPMYMSPQLFENF